MFYTVPNPVAPSTYAQTVLSQGAGTYWRLGEATAGTAIDQVGYNDGAESAGVTGDAAGAIIGDTDTAVTLSGAITAIASTRAPITAPDTFTAQAWFRTTSNTGGRIIGMSNLAVSNSNVDDRHTYLDNAGHLYFGVNNGSPRTLNTTKTYNDGQWHQVVTSLGADGMTLYVDGLRVAKRADVTTGRAYSGYWRVGGDNLNGWPAKPTGYLWGTVDEASIYPTVLTKDQVLAQYVASGRPSPLPSAPTDSYDAAVYSDQPDLFYRLGESSGIVATDTSASLNPGTYVGASTRGVLGAINGSPDPSTTFDGSTGFVACNSSFAAPSTFRAEAWFKTTTTRGGKIIGFGNAATGLSTSYDRHVYLQNDGKVVFGVYTGVQVTVISPTAYNDGQWHHVVATQGSDGMTLYLDAQLIGSNATTNAQNYPGFWRIGADRTWNSLSPYLAGSIDEAAVYPRALSASRVIAHWKASGRTLANVAPAAAFTSSAAGLNLSVDGSTSSDPDGTVTSYTWTFGDGSTGTGSTAAHRYAAAGSYPVALTVTDNSGATNSITTSATVANTPPVAAFTSGVADLTVSVDGSTSTDPDGTIGSYSWKYGDGGTGTGAIATHTYPSAGTYAVSLTVIDNAGGTTTTTGPVTITPANVLPTAAFTSTAQNLVLSVDGSGSSDPDGSVSSYAWTFGDGATGTGSTATHTFAAGGTYQVGLTVNNRGGTATRSRSVTLTAPNAATDAFGRTVAGGWGSADFGGAWTLNGTASLFSVNGSAGQIRMASAGAGPMAFLNSVNAATVTCSVDIAVDKAPTGSGFQGNAMIRRVPGTGATFSDYRFKLRLMPTSTTVQISKVVNNVETLLAAQTVTALTYQVGDVIRLSYQATGSAPTTLSVKAWKAGTTESSTWRATVSDADGALQGPGALGLQAYLTNTATNAPVVASFDNLTVTTGP